MDWKARAERLALFTVLYNLLEGAVSVWFGVAESSVALAGFGADSFIEVASAAAVLWRLRGGAEERRATRAIGALFLALAAATAAASVLELERHSAPATTLPGAVIALASLSFMFWLWRAKLAAGRALSSPTVLADAACSLACIKLSGVLLAGSAVYAAAPELWWADSAAALALSVLIAREGVELVRGGGCCGEPDCGAPPRAE